MNFSSLLPRVVTASLLLGLLAFVLYMGSTWLSLLAFMFAALALWELYSLFWQEQEQDVQALKVTGIALCGFVFCMSWLYASHWRIEMTLATAMLCLVVLGILFLVRFSKKRESASVCDIALVLFGLIYVAMPIVLTLQLGIIHLLVIFGITVVSDTVAYMVGNVCGKHKIWPQVSPNKSVEGCIGGLLGGALVCVAFFLYDNNLFGSLLFAAFSGVLLSVAAMFGDFFESALKRTYNVKDSGTLLPGHGGVLDRLDSFLFVAPVYFLLHFL